MVLGVLNLNKDLVAVFLLQDLNKDLFLGVFLVVLKVFLVVLGVFLVVLGMVLVVLNIEQNIEHRTLFSEQ